MNTNTNNMNGMNNNFQGQLVSYLNQYLSNIAVFTNNMYIYHWNIVGPMFFPLHTKFQEYYEKGSEEFDLIAERIRQLGGLPVTINQYSTTASLNNAASKIYTTNEAITNSISDFKFMHRMGSDIASYAESIGDGVTSALIGDFLKYLEKQLWMLEANIK